ncbi:MAG: sensor domain-containing diguanylate cyclase [Deltaproteobacteria bacterium]|nr:sensor domain-containing diguanylate cyclase [Deltaproteobacteria bacterium]
MEGTMSIEYDFREVVDNLYDGLYIVDRDRRITFWNQAAENITGYSAEEVMGRSCADNLLNPVDGLGNEMCRNACPLAATMADGQSRETELYLHHKEGHRLPVSVRTAPLRNRKGTVTGCIEMFTNISFREALRLQLEEWKKVALMDPLTELPNRRQLELQIRGRLHELKRNAVSCGILFVDIDHFKNVNDTYGHDTGDQVLRTVAKTLTSSIRPFDTVGRWGGEEFVGIFPHTNRKTLLKIANRLRMLVEHSSIETGRGPLSFTVSVGGVLGVAEDSVDSIIKRADARMYESKEKGRNCVTMEKRRPPSQGRRDTLTAVS